MKYLITLISGLLFCATISAQDCPGGVCLPPSKAAVVAPAGTAGDALASHLEQNPQYEWVQNPNNPDQVFLTRNFRTVGQWFDGQYYPWDGKKVLAPTKPPIDPPTHGVQSIQEWQKKGISTRTDREQISRGGKVYPVHKLNEVFEGVEIDDDSAKGHFVIVAKNPELRAKVFEDWQKLPDDFRSRYNVWMPPPEHFSMFDRFNNKSRFYTEGDPSVILQSHDGTVLFRRPQAQQVYKTADMQDLLKSDPNYNPKLDPGAPEAPAVALTTQSKVALAAAGVGLFLVLRRKK